VRRGVATRATRAGAWRWVRRRPSFSSSRFDSVLTNQWVRRRQVVAAGGALARRPLLWPRLWVPSSVGRPEAHWAVRFREHLNPQSSRGRGQQVRKAQSVKGKGLGTPTCLNLACCESQGSLQRNGEPSRGQRRNDLITFFPAAFGGHPACPVLALRAGGVPLSMRLVAVGHQL